MHQREDDSNKTKSVSANLDRRQMQASSNKKSVHLKANQIEQEQQQHKEGSIGHLKQ